MRLTLMRPIKRQVCAILCVACTTNIRRARFQLRCCIELIGMSTGEPDGLEQYARLEAADTAALQADLKHRRRKEGVRGRAVAHQQTLWERILEIRILLQRALVASHRLPAAMGRSAAVQVCQIDVLGYACGALTLPCLPIGFKFAIFICSESCTQQPSNGPRQSSAHSQMRACCVQDEAVHAKFSHLTSQLRHTLQELLAVHAGLLSQNPSIR